MGFFQRKTDIRTTIRKKARLQASIAEAEAEGEERIIQARKRGIMRARGTGSRGVGSAFTGFQSFASEFAKRQQEPSPAVKKRIKRKKRRKPTAVQKGRVIQLRI